MFHAVKNLLTYVSRNIYIYIYIYTHSIRYVEFPRANLNLYTALCLYFGLESQRFALHIT
jgi:uncharacterized membrane protein